MGRKGIEGEDDSMVFPPYCNYNSQSAGFVLELNWQMVDFPVLSARLLPNIEFLLAIKIKALTGIGECDACYTCTWSCKKRFSSA